MSEATRYEMAARFFRFPITFTLNPSTIRDHYFHPTRTPLSALTASFASDFYKKDTAVYNLALRSPDNEDVFEVIWKTWYPRRNLHPKIDGVWQGFWCRALSPSLEQRREPVTIVQALGHYEELLEVADAHEKSDADVGQKLEEGFRQALVVIDKEEWATEGVLVVCRQEHVAKFGLVTKGGQAVQGKDGGWLAFRMSMEDAVKTVIWDPERRKAEAPTLEAYRDRAFGY
ncbi:hypothetical protein AJ80_09109 [Polytolypa hystricis UAMH7299]|uniref:Uncharacterized protein n=1 Tax=Polytolypa hystricis (strain UAMH7299) TaxID=1447883 RepID=A0A2B7WWC1_POLH7|nr:hypothetical protein AJ80_09109 [Polytolypa hystricis UAMH7299]